MCTPEGTPAVKSACYYAVIQTNARIEEAEDGRAGNFEWGPKTTAGVTPLNAWTSERDRFAVRNALLNSVIRGRYTETRHAVT